MRVDVVCHNCVNVPVEFRDAGSTATLKLAAAGQTASFSMSAAAVTEKNGMLTATLDGTGHWLLPDTDVPVTVSVETGGALISSSIFTVSADDLSAKKTKTVVAGTTLGQFGISLTIAASDADGYRQRLTAFMQRHNPAGLEEVPRVVESVDEVSAFCRLNKRFGVVDYRARIIDFFELYGPEHVALVDEVLREWEGKEEEFIRQLILDNGPEPADIDRQRRLDAFIENHPGATGAVRHAGPTGSISVGDFAALMQQLRQQFGQEPHPQTYLFPATVFDTPHLTQLASSLGRGASHAAGASVPLPPLGESVAPLAAEPIKSGSAWESLTSRMQGARISESELYYLTETGFAALVRDVGVPVALHAALKAEWDRRMAEALKVAYLSPGDAAFGAARKEAVQLSAMDPLGVQVVGAVGIRHVEHERAFERRVASARAGRPGAGTSDFVAKRVLVGDHDELMHFARCGVDVRRPFASRPFATAGEEPQTVTLLLCDVFVGDSFKAQRRADISDEVRHQYDSAALTEGTNDMLEVFSPQSVLPRFLLHCQIEPAAASCEHHPNRRVEYFIPAAGVFACGQCIVVGPHRGADVIPADEAVVAARARLSSLCHKAEARTRELTAREQAIEVAAAEATGPEPLRRAREAAEELVRDAQRKAAEMVRDAERKQAEEAADLRRRHEVALREAQRAQRTAAEMTANLRSANPTRILLSLQDAEAEFGATGSVFAPAAIVGANATTTIQTNGSGRGFAMPGAGGGADGMSIGLAGMMHRTPAPAGRTGGLAAGSFPTPASSAAPSRHADPAAAAHRPTAAADSEIYSQFSAIKSQQQQRAAATPSASRADGQSVAADSVTTPGVSERKRTKEEMTAGWAACRAGDTEKARQLWGGIFERHQNDSVGARARAYICEAIERDFGAATTWYERALRHDPNDIMTLFNFGVMLESTGSRGDALRLFDSAHRLGDATAGKRAVLLRKAMGVE